VPALLAAVLALVVTLVMAAYVNRQRSLSKD
jgi:ABC-type Fe3+ transport system permease subunit